MQLKFRTTLLAGTIAALLAGPTLAASDSAEDRAQTPSSAAAQQEDAARDKPTAAPPMPEAAQQGSAYGRQGMGNNPLYRRSADDLDGVEVVDRAGDKVGTIKKIVLAQDHKSAHAVISAGGILGMGARNIIVSLDELTPIDDKLQMSATEEEIAALKQEAPDTDTYVEVKGDKPISESIVVSSAPEDDKKPSTPAATSEAPDTPR